VDTTGNLYVANNVFSPSVTVYAPGANGNVAPLRIVNGASTGLNSPFGVAVDAAGNLYVANNGGIPPGITVYGSGANGNATPIRTISGSNTGLNIGAGFITVL
jgi:hypothetical protein